MAQNYYLRKLSLKLLLVYLFAIILVVLGKPQVGSVQYIIGMGLIFSGIMIRTWAAGHLAKNERLVTSGPYRFVKNPLYIGTSKIVVGVCLIAQGPLTRPGFQELFPMIVTAIFFVFFLAYYVPYKMKKEYKRLERLFPEEWKAYDAGVPDYIPNFKGYDSAGKWDFSAYFNNSEHWTLASIVILVILLHFNEYVTRIFT